MNLIKKNIKQFSKFSLIGVLNTVIDIGLLNILIFITGIFSGFYYSVFKVISFLVANINSYFFNKNWAFKDKESSNTKKYSSFLIVSVLSLIINVLTASLIVNYISAPQGVSASLWANVGAVSATVVSLLWNFFGYKLIVFKK